MVEPKLILNQIQAANVLGVHRDTLRRWQRAKFVPHRIDPVTGHVFYSRPALERWAAERSNEAVAS